MIRLTQFQLMCFFSIGILFFSGFFLFLFDPDNPTRMYAIISAGFYLLSTILVLNNLNKALSIAIYSFFPLALCAFAFVSVLWAHNESLALTRSIALLGTFLFSLAMIVCLDENNVLKALSFPLVFAAFIALFVGLLVPSIGVDDGSNVPAHTGLWQGTYAFKNRLGRVMGIIAVILITIEIWRPLIQRSLLVLILGILLMSASSTPILSLLFVILVLAYLNVASRLNTYQKAIFFIFGASLLVITPSIIERIVVDIMNKDLSGSGRFYMWKDIITNIDRPWLGYGFGGGFWGEDGAANYLLDPKYVDVGHAHNGMIDSLISFGLAGAILYTSLLIVGIIHTYKHRDKSILSNVAFSLLIFFFAYSISGSTFIKQNDIMFAIVCISCFAPFISSRQI